MKYYDMTNLLEKDCDYNFIVSGRGTGKSTTIINHLIDDYCTKGYQFCRIARYDFEIKPSVYNNWFNHVNIEHLQQYGFVSCGFSRNTFYFQDESGEKYIAGYVVSLNNQDIFKSGVSTNIQNIVFEEFCAMSERDYYRGEIQAFLSALSTIVRSRNGVKCYFIGNTLTKHNPYFDFFGIDIDRLGFKAGDLLTFKVKGFYGMGATIALEYVDMAYDDINEIPSILRVCGNDTATTGLYVISHETMMYDTFKELIDVSPFTNFLNEPVVYIGANEFYSCRISKHPLIDGRRIICAEPLTVTPKLLESKMLNLSGVYNPTITIGEQTYHLNTMSAEIYYADKRFTDLVTEWKSCEKCMSDDTIKTKLFNFIDKWDRW